MVDLSEFYAVVDRNRKGPSCSAGWVLDALSDDQRAKYEAAVLDPRITATAIVDVLQSWGYELQVHTLRRHQRGLCRCGDG